MCEVAGKIDYHKPIPPTVSGSTPVKAVTDVAVSMRTMFVFVVCRSLVLMHMHL